MKSYTLKLELASPTLVGSAEGFGAVIDSDVVFDDVGLPYVPAKRIKGCLLDSAKVVHGHFDRADIVLPMAINEAFGVPGAASPARVFFSNLFVEDYASNRAWLAYLLARKEYGDLLSREQILGTFTHIRQQTAIDPDGIAYDHSLRTIRVLDEGLTFEGALHIQDEDSAILDTLLLACLNFRHMGGKRNRGFGKVRCRLLDGDIELSIIERLEALCTN